MPESRLRIAPLVRATRDPEEIVRIEAARTLCELIGAQAADTLISTPGLLEHPAVIGGLWIPPRRRAVELASGVPKRDDLLKSLEPVQHHTIISRLIQAAGSEYDPDKSDIYDRLAAGNEVAGDIAKLGKDWDPDILALFQIYLALFDKATAERLNWIGTAVSSEKESVAVEMPLVVPAYAGALTTSWQIAWAASRAPLASLLKDIAPAMEDQSPKVRWAAAQFLGETAKYRHVDYPPQFGGGTGPRSLKDEADTLEELVLNLPAVKREEKSVVPAARPIDPEVRYADLRFLRDKDNSPDDAIEENTTLKAGRWYWLEVGVRVKTIGLKDGDKTPKKPFREVHQKAPIDILVTADSDDFEIESQVDRITLPPTGDSTHNAKFHIRPEKLSDLSSNPASIHLRFFYRFNLLEYVSAIARIENSEEQKDADVLRKVQHEVSREYLDFDEFLPRKMNIHVTHREDIYFFQFTLEGEGGGPVILRAQSKLTSKDFEDSLVQLRETLNNLVLEDYLQQVGSSAGVFRDAIRKLAKLGRQLWLALFKNEPGSALDLVGRALSDRPVEEEGLIQISMPGMQSGFIYPWAFLYDRPVPEENYVLPNVKGFWGYRYSLEQHLPGQVKNTDVTRKTGDCLRMAFMLWEDFPNAAQQRQLMTELSKGADGKLLISDPPVTTRDDFYSLIEHLRDSILYFYTHGHSKAAKTAAKGPGLTRLAETKLAQNVGPSAERELLEALLKRLKEQESGPDESYIELSHGRLYYYDLLESVETLSSEPFVFLNMCESAEMVPLFTENFVALFLKLGARAVIGTECTMTVSFAHPFSQVFLGEVLRGERLADALRIARRRFLDNRNPLGLAYTLFGLGTTQFLPARLPQSVTPNRKITE